MHAAGQGPSDNLISARLYAITRDEPNVTDLVERIRQRSGQVTSSPWERDASTERPVPADQRVASLRRRLGGSFRG